MRQLSGEFLKYPEVYSSIVSLQIRRSHVLASSEGTALIRPGASARMVIQGGDASGRWYGTDARGDFSGGVPRPAS